MGVYPMQALTLAASTRACGGAWRLVELCFSRCAIAGVDEHGESALASESKCERLGTVNAIDEGKICYKGGQRIHWVQCYERRHQASCEIGVRRDKNYKRIYGGERWGLSWFALGFGLIAVI